MGTPGSCLGSRPFCVDWDTAKITGRILSIRTRRDICNLCLVFQERRIWRRWRSQLIQMRLKLGRDFLGIGKVKAIEVDGSYGRYGRGGAAGETGLWKDEPGPEEVGYLGS